MNKVTNNIFIQGVQGDADEMEGYEQTCHCA